MRDGSLRNEKPKSPMENCRESKTGKLQRIQARKIRANVEIEDHNIADLLS
jgi:hypothetical protein